MTTRPEAIEAIRNYRRALDAFNRDHPPTAESRVDDPFSPAELEALLALGEVAERARDARAWLLEHGTRAEFDQICRDIKGARR